MQQAEQFRNARAPLRRLLTAAAAALSLGVALAACDDNRDQSGAKKEQGAPGSQAQTTPPQAPPRSTPEPAQPPRAAPGAGPSAERVLGTWSVFAAPGGPPRSGAQGDKAEGTTYRFEEGGKVTVAGSKQCTYALEPGELKIDCGGTATAGKVEFPDSQTMVWTVGANETVTLKRR